MVAALLLATVPAGAAPLEPLRATPRPALDAGRSTTRRSGFDAALPVGEGVARVCGSGLDATREALGAHVAREECAPLPTPHSRDIDGCAVLEDDGTLFYQGSGGHIVFDVIAASQAFYRTHGDDYDFIAFYLSSGLSAWLGSPGALAAAYPLRNTTQGIGLDLFDYGAMAGSAARLQVPLSMNGLDRYPGDPEASFSPTDAFSTLDVLAHETAHRWLAYVEVESAGAAVPALLGRDYQHWNFFADVDSSVMEGCDWARPAPDSFITDGVINGYGVLDQYLMGLRSKSEVDSFFVVNDPHAFNPPGTYVPYSIPEVGISCRGRATFWHVSDIEAVHGPRVPDAASSPHAFRMAMVLVTARGNDASAPDLAKFGLIRARFPGFFATATQGRGSMDVTLDSHAGHVEIAHVPLKDTEDVSSPRPIGARVTLEGGGLPLVVDPASVRAYWRTGSVGPFTAAPLASVAADSFAGALPPEPSGTRVEYYLYAASDSSGIDAYDPPAGPAAPHSYEVGTDVTPPQVVHAAIHEERYDRLPRTFLARVTDNLGVDSVWVEFSKNGGALQSGPATAAGRDSFAAVIGVGALPGDRYAYRFLARDRAAVPNVGTSNAAFDSLDAGFDVREEFENGAADFTHTYATGSYRDAWHLSDEWSSPAGGTGWKCGACGDLAYPPRLDATLDTRYFSIPPGTLLRFDHRYDLEQYDSHYAWDGARVEVQVGANPWQVATPAGGYDHVLIDPSSPLGGGTPCWSGRSTTWRSEVVDLTPWAPGPMHVRFRMAADDFIGYQGWFVDHIQFDFPDGGVSAVAPGGAAQEIGAPWPNPARERLMLALYLPHAARGEWSLHDLAGRRVATLWRGVAPAGVKRLEALLPGLASGVYFARLELDGRVMSRSRVAILR